ncbi:Ig-like domain-containing protein [uncultured Sphaerochaeta sp.]|uniref:Ig-like domain-containing protein n=1 Tax=uncultured Sphaerochaeta sp. TaxID=886478 RepID=UPI0029C9D79B|nr:Ig-like domain-containing protein [uncultured Sphaerochaeta sp.]
MKKQRSINTMVILLSMVILCVLGCNLYDTTASLVIQIPLLEERETHKPDVSLSAARYIIHGDGPNGESFSGTLNSSWASYQKDGLSAGEWTITVDCYNNERNPVLIGRGIETIVLKPASKNYVTIDISLTEGAGDFVALLSWGDLEGSYILDYSITEALSGTLKKEVEISVDGSSYTLELDSFPTGDYLLHLTLSHDQSVVYQTLESFRIQDSLRTNASIEFSLDKMGSLSANLVMVESSPLDFSIKGPSIEVPSTEVLTYTIEGIEDLDYIQWYFDGLAIPYANTNTLFLGDGLSPGHYNITAVVTKDSRLGSKTITVDVQDTVLALVVGETYPSSETGPSEFNIRQVIPFEDQENVSVDSLIAISFSSFVDPSTVNERSIEILASGIPVSGTFFVETVRGTEQSVLSFSPVKPFPEETLITINLLGFHGIRNLRGTSLNGDFSYSFKTDSSCEDASVELKFPLDDWTKEGSAGYVSLPYGLLLGNDVVFGESIRDGLLIATNTFLAHGIVDHAIGETYSTMTSGTIDVPPGATKLLMDYCILTQEPIEEATHYPDGFVVHVKGSTGSLIHQFDAVQDASDFFSSIRTSRGKFYRSQNRTLVIDLESIGDMLTLQLLIFNQGDTFGTTCGVFGNIRFEEDAQ